MTPYDAQVRASFWFGLGTAAALFGIGLGGQPNKLALLTAVGSLVYANHLNPVVDVAPRPELQYSLERARAQVSPSSLYQTARGAVPSGRLQFAY